MGGPRPYFPFTIFFMVMVEMGKWYNVRQYSMSLFSTTFLRLFPRSDGVGVFLQPLNQPLLYDCFGLTFGFGTFGYKNVTSGWPSHSTYASSMAREARLSWSTPCLKSPYFSPLLP
jgi:hypothetical protein